jgi:hypothetical protein
MVASGVPKNSAPNAMAFNSNGEGESRKTKVGWWMIGNIGITFLKNMCKLLSRKRDVSPDSTVGVVTLQNCIGSQQVNWLYLRRGIHTASPSSPLSD